MEKGKEDLAAWFEKHGFKVVDLGAFSVEKESPKREPYQAKPEPVPEDDPHSYYAFDHDTLVQSFGVKFAQSDLLPSGMATVTVCATQDVWAKRGFKVRPHLMQPVRFEGGVTPLYLAITRFFDTHRGHTSHVFLEDLNVLAVEEKPSTAQFPAFVSLVGKGPAATLLANLAEVDSVYREHILHTLRVLLPRNQQVVDDFEEMFKRGTFVSALNRWLQEKS